MTVRGKSGNSDLLGEREREREREVSSSIALEIVMGVLGGFNDTG